jgi:putative flavoprotein involved in K+ transport
VLVDAGYIEALKRGEVEIVTAVEAFERDEVVLADGSRLRPDAVIAATGFRSGLEELVGHLGVLGEDCYPLVRRTDMPNAPGIFFNGFYASMAGQLIHMRSDARHIARAIARRLRGDPHAARSPVRVPRPA